MGVQDTILPRCLALVGLQRRNAPLEGEEVLVAASAITAYRDIVGIARLRLDRKAPEISRDARELSGNEAQNS